MAAHVINTDPDPQHPINRTSGPPEHSKYAGFSALILHSLPLGRDSSSIWGTMMNNNF